MVSRKIKAIVFPLFLLFLLFVAAVIFVNELIQRPSVQRYLVQELSKAVGYDLRATQIELSVRKGIGISARGFKIGSVEGGPILSASRIRIHLNGRALLEGRIVPTRLVLIEPELTLGLTGRGTTRPSSPPVAIENMLGSVSAFSSLCVERGHVTLSGMPFDLENFDLDLSRTNQNPLAFSLFSRAEATYQGENIPLSVTGSVTQNRGEGLSGGITLSAGAMPLAVLPWPEDLPFKGGHGKIRLKARGSLKAGVALDGVLDVTNPDFMIIDEGDKKRFAFDRLTIPFDARYSGSVLALPEFTVKGEGMSLSGTARIDFKKTSNPEIFLQVTNPFMPLPVFKKVFPSSLLPSWLNAELFPCFSDGEVRVDDFSLKGTLREIEDLDYYENASALKLVLTCQGLTVFKGADGPPMQNVSGRMVLEKGIFRVTDVTGLFGSSEFKGGSFTVDTVYSDTPSYDASLAGSFDIQDVLKEQGLDCIPPRVTRVLERWDTASLLKTHAVSGRLDAQVAIGYQKGWGLPRISSAAFQFKKCHLTLKDLMLPVYVETGTLTRAGKKGWAFSGAGRWGRSNLKLSGSLEDSWKTGKAHMLVQADLEQLFHQLYPSLKGTIHARKPVSARLDLSRDQGYWACQGTLDPKGVFLETDTVVISPFGYTGDLSFDGQLIPGKRIVVDVLKTAPPPKDQQGTSKAPLFSLSGTYDLEGEHRADIQVKARHLKLQDLGVTFKEKYLAAEGLVSCDARVKINEAEPLKTGVTGVIQGKRIGLKSEVLPKPVKDMDFKVRCRGQTYHLDFLTMSMGSNAFQVEGTLHGWEGIQGELAVTSDDLNVSELIDEKKRSRLNERSAGPQVTLLEKKKGSAEATGQKRFIRASNIKLSLDVKKGRWGQVVFGPVDAICAIRGRGVYVNRADVGLEYGRARIKGHITKGKRVEAALSTYINLTRIPVKELPHAFDPIKEYIEGDLSLEGLLYVKGSNKQAWVSSLTGGANVLIEKGVIKRSNIFIKILDFLSLKELFTKDENGSTAKGLKFDKIEGPVDIENGIAQVERIRLRGPVLNAVGRGKVNLMEKTVDGEVGVEPLGTIDLVISHLPIVGHLLTGDKKALYVDYFKVAGPLDNPEVRYIPFKGLGSGTIGFIKRLFLSPGRLIKDISDKKRDFERKGIPMPDTLQPEKDMGP